MKKGAEKEVLMTEAGNQGEFKATGRNAKCYQEMPHEKD